VERCLCLNRFGGSVWVERVGGTRGRRKGGKGFLVREEFQGWGRAAMLGRGVRSGGEEMMYVVQGNRTPYPHMIKEIWVMGHVAHPIYCNCVSIHDWQGNDHEDWRIDKASRIAVREPLLSHNYALQDSHEISDYVLQHDHTYGCLPHSCH